jgi:hypothetical protein
MKRYASLVGPLLGVYYPLPAFDSEVEERVALNTSRLSLVWCTIYNEEEVDRQMKQFPGSVKLPDRFAALLDYDSHEVNRV